MVVPVASLLEFHCVDLFRKSCVASGSVKTAVHCRHYGQTSEVLFVLIYIKREFEYINNLLKMVSGFMSLRATLLRFA